MNGSVGWADAGVLIPYRFWKIYNDDCLIREFYDKMVKYAEFMISRCGKWTPLRHRINLKSKKYLVNFGQSYGEWAEPKDVFPNDWKTRCCRIPRNQRRIHHMFSALCAK